MSLALELQTMSPTDITPPIRFISIKEACLRTSLSRATIYRLIAEGKFPRLVPLHGARKAFLESEIESWMAARLAARDAEAA